MPGLMSRICGICPASHVLASSKAGDALLGVESLAAAAKQRRLVNYAQISAVARPELLPSLRAGPAAGHGLAARDSATSLACSRHDPDFARRGIRLRQFGQRIIELVGGKRIHPAWGAPGGV